VLVRRERSFFAATREEAEALAAPFVASTNGEIFYNAPIWTLPLPGGFRQSPNGRWTSNISRRWLTPRSDYVADAGG
jgi:hypothetical protein